MWITSSYAPSSDIAYIVASIGNSTRVESGRLFTRFVTITFPPPAASLSVSGFFTDPSLNPLALDNSSNPMVTSVLARGIVQSSNPGQVLAWVNVTNTGSVPLQSLILNETLPIDWTVSPPWMRGKGAAHVYFANTTSLGANLEITQQSSLTVSSGNPETVSLAIANFTATMIGHPLLPGETVLLSVKLAYGLVKTSQSLASYPRNYADHVIDRLHAANVNMIANPATNLMLQGRLDDYPKRRGVTQVKELLAAGVNVACGQDCVHDTFYPFGQNDPLEIAFLLCHASQMSQPAEILSVMDMVTGNGAKAMRAPDHRVAVGGVADLVVLDARDASEAFATRAPRRWVIGKGRLIAETSLRTRRYFAIPAAPNV